MTAYSKTELDNLFIQKQAKEAFDEAYISAETKAEIFQRHPVALYMPNVAVKIGLGVLTTFIVFAALGLFILFFNLHSFDAVLMFIGIACYVLLEVMTMQKRHYNSGVDNLLMFAVVIFISSGIGGALHQSPEVILSLVVFVITAWFAVRFADSLAGIVATVALLSFVFNGYVSLGEFTISSFPYLLIIVSAALYFFTNKKLKAGFSIYQPVWKAASVTAMIALYLAGNFYVVDNLTDTSYLIKQNSALHASWFFWIYTLVVPIVYLISGMKKRNIIMIRVSVLLIAASIFTVRYYHTIISMEAAMILAGSIILLASYALMRYLKTSRHGFIFYDKKRKNKHPDLEAFIIGEAFGAKHTTPDGQRFGGGSFGGAGAGDTY